MIATEQPVLPKWPDGKKILFFILLGFICALIGWCSHGSPEPVNINTVIKKGVINKQKRIADSLDKRSDITDSIRIVYVTRWRTLKPKLDSIPCPEALADIIILTDSIITVDSTQISQLNAELFVADLIIANQDTIIRNDSVTIGILNKKLRRQRLKIAAAAVGGFVMGVFIRR